MTFNETRKAYADMQAVAQAEAANRRLLARAALDYISGKIDAHKLLELAQGMLK